MKRLLACLVISASILTGCGDDDPRIKQSSSSTSQSTSPAKPIELSEVASFDQPIAMAVRNDKIFIAEKGGRIRQMVPGQEPGGPLLDISESVSTGSEQGLLGIAFAPDGRHLYINYTDVSGDTQVVEYAMDNEIVDLSSRRQLLFVDQPFPNHNGGHLAFGRDGFLYIGLGDGGSGDDPMGNGQKLDTLLGKILRIDPRPDGSKPYSIPKDNPFVNQRDARPEIWAYGLRNPWRFSFDRETGDLWIADVGQQEIEEVNMASAASKGGENYGWDRFEGTRRFEGPEPKNTVKPIYEYEHSNGGCSVTGGYVYRGKIAALKGNYLFGDFCIGKLMALSRVDEKWEARDLGVSVDELSSFGEDGAGEIYVMSLGGKVFRLG